MLRLFVALALAHQIGVSYGDMRVAGNRVEGELRVNTVELSRAVNLDADRDGRLTQHDLDLMGGRLFGRTLDNISILQDGRRCPLTPGRATLDPPDGLRVTGTWICPRPVDDVQVRVGLLDAFPLGHAHLTRVEVAGRVEEHMARAGDDTFEIHGPPGFVREGLRFLALGVEHIFTGYDHIAFLVGLLLLGGTLAELVKIVTAFTIAHSITLAVATVGLLTPSPRLVEPAIAASIVYVALENVWATRRDAKPVLGHRWMITFAFGLVHGFGFASVLRELHLPRSSLAASLVTFNLGVELGQICIVAIAFPALVWLRRKPRFRTWGVRGASAAIAGAGLFWLVQRIFWPTF